MNSIVSTEELLQALDKEIVMFKSKIASYNNPINSNITNESNKIEEKTTSSLVNVDFNEWKQNRKSDFTEKPCDPPAAVIFIIRYIVMILLDGPLSERDMRRLLVDVCKDIGMNSTSNNFLSGLSVYISSVCGALSACGIIVPATNQSTGLSNNLTLTNNLTANISHNLTSNQTSLPNNLTNSLTNSLPNNLANVQSIRLALQQVRQQYHQMFIMGSSLMTSLSPLQLTSQLSNETTNHLIIESTNHLTNGSSSKASKSSTITFNNLINKTSNKGSYLQFTTSNVLQFENKIVFDLLTHSIDTTNHLSSNVTSIPCSNPTTNPSKNTTNGIIAHLSTNLSNGLTNGLTNNTTNGLTNKYSNIINFLSSYIDRYSNILLKFYDEIAQYQCPSHPTNKSNATTDKQVDKQLDIQIDKKVEGSIDKQIDTSVVERPIDLTINKTDNKINNHTDNKVGSSIDSKTDSHIDSQIINNIDSKIDSQVDSKTDNQINSLIVTGIPTKKRIRNQKRWELNYNLSNQIDKLIDQLIQWHELNYQQQNELEKEECLLRQISLQCNINISTIPNRLGTNYLTNCQTIGLSTFPTNSLYNDRVDNQTINPISNQFINLTNNQSVNSTNSSTNQSYRDGYKYTANSLYNKMCYNKRKISSFTNEHIPASSSLTLPQQSIKRHNSNSSSTLSISSYKNVNRLNLNSDYAIEKSIYLTGSLYTQYLPVNLSTSSSNTKINNYEATYILPDLIIKTSEIPWRMIANEFVVSGPLDTSIVSHSSKSIDHVIAPNYRLYNYTTNPLDNDDSNDEIDEDLSDEIYQLRHENGLKQMREHWSLLQQLRFELKHNLLDQPINSVATLSTNSNNYIANSLSNKLTTQLTNQLPNQLINNFNKKFINKTKLKNKKLKKNFLSANLTNNSINSHIESKDQNQNSLIIEPSH